MKVYKFTTEAPYSGGCVIIVANNENEATDILKEKISLYNWFSEPIEITELTANVDTPQILVNEYYIE